MRASSTRPRSCCRGYCESGSPPCYNSGRPERPFFSQDFQAQVLVICCYLLCKQSKPMTQLVKWIQLDGMAIPECFCMIWSYFRDLLCEGFCVLHGHRKSQSQYREPRHTHSQPQELALYHDSHSLKSTAAGEKTTNKPQQEGTESKAHRFLLNVGQMRWA